MCSLSVTALWAYSPSHPGLTASQGHLLPKRVLRNRPAAAGSLSPTPRARAQTTAAVEAAAGTTTARRHHTSPVKELNPAARQPLTSATISGRMMGSWLKQTCHLWLSNQSTPLVGSVCQMTCLSTSCRTRSMSGCHGNITSLGGEGHERCLLFAAVCASKPDHHVYTFVLTVRQAAPDLQQSSMVQSMCACARLTGTPCTC